MSTKINLYKEVRDRDEFVKTVNTNFTQLSQTNPQQEFIKQPSVKEFFNLYNTLFYQIPPQGPLSHQTLIEQSAEYVKFDPNDEIIQQAQAEIDLLRDDLLEANKEISELTAQILQLQSQLQQ